LRVLECGCLRIFEPRRERERERESNRRVEEIARSFLFVIFTKYYDDQIMKDERGGPCWLHGEYEKLKGREHLGNVDADGKMTQWVLKE
jgi:hypothetical protein